MEEIYLKLASIKFKSVDYESKAREIFNVLNLLTNNEIANFNFHALSNIYSKEVLTRLFEFLFNLSSKSINLNSTVYLCSQLNHFDSSTDVATFNTKVIEKLLCILRNMDDGKNIFYLLQIISLKYPLVMKNLISENLLQNICLLNHRFEIETFEKILLLTIQELYEVDMDVLLSLKRISDDISGENDLFLRLISSISVTASVSEDVLTSGLLWNTILNFLVSPNTVDRKRAMYWLNRALNTYRAMDFDRLVVKLPQESLLLDLNDDIINSILILIDALEEKQTHVILPVLSKINNLKSFLSENRMSIHWLLTVIEKASLHESTIILKWAITEFLSLPIHLSCSSYYRILSTSYIKTINQSNLYFSPDSISNDNGFFASKCLDNFHNQLFSEFSKSGNTEKLETFLDIISLYPWNSHALLFVAESFSKILLTEFEFPISVLSKIGTTCRLNLVTSNLKYRQCIASFFLTGFFRNHQILSDNISGYINILYNNFNLKETVLFDQTLLTLLTTSFESLSKPDCEHIFQTIREQIESFEINNVNFSGAFNRLSCMSLVAVMISSTISDNDLSDFLELFLNQIRQSYLNPYANFSHVLKAIIMLQQLHLVSVKVPINSKFTDTITDSISLVLVEIMKYLSLKIEESDLKNEIEVNSVSIFKYFVKNFSKPICDMYFKEGPDSLTMKSLIATNIPNYVTNITGDLNLVSLLDKTNLSHTNALQYEKLKCLARYIANYRDRFESLSEIENLVDYICAIVDITVPYKGIIAVIHLASAVIEELHHDQSSACIVAMVRCIWSSVLEHNSNAQTFWKLYSVFLERIVQQLLTTHHKYASDELVLECLERIIDTVFRMGENKFGMVHLLGDTVHEFFVTQSIVVSEENSDFYINLIGRLIVFGPCHRRGLRFENRIERYLSKEYGDRWNSYRINKTAESGERVGGLLIVCLKKALPVEFKEELISYLRNKDCDIAGSGVKSYKNYANNHIHRTRHRLFSVLLLVLDSAIGSLSSDCLDNLEQWMINSLQFESLNSIRYLSEWIYTLLCSHDRDKQARLISAVKCASDSKPAYVCSLITCCRHLVTSEDLVLAILPLGSAQNYNIRLYAVSFISIISKQLSSNSQLAAIIDSYLSFLDRSTMAKNVDKLLTNFWWTKFSPFEDVCLETIFSVLPPLFDLVEEEMITVDQFESVAAADASLYGVRFGNTRPHWHHDDGDCVWRVRTAIGGGHAEVQKKIQPWITCRPDEDQLRELYGPVTPASDLVLVCSLVDKPTNIGGLARTSNIFGVGEFVVDNLRIVEDTGFRQLAVTADKWIHMTEVSVATLAQFVAVKRADGYEIVGVEQTNNSVSLQSVRFRGKTVLVLGNEKEGIPAELISLMDKCVQIPQWGQIRSLNVHVSGALVLWEYMKQMRLTEAQ